MARKMVTATCLNCEQTFEVSASRVRYRGAKYCSPLCAHAHRRGKPRALGVRPAPEEKTCPVCGKTFLVGGRLGSRRDRRFCSLVCGGLGAPRQPETESATLSVADAAYLAGIMDGEGQIALRFNRRSGSVYLEIGVTNSHLPVLEWIVQKTGIGGIMVHRAAGFQGHAWKQTWVWRCQSLKAASILTQVRPYLLIKAERADLALETQDRLLDPALRGDRAWQDAYFQRMKALNRPGVPGD